MLNKEPVNIETISKEESDEIGDSVWSFSAIRTALTDSEGQELGKEEDKLGLNGLWEYPQTPSQTHQCRMLDPPVESEEFVKYPKSIQQREYVAKFANYEPKRTVSDIHFKTNLRTSAAPWNPKTPVKKYSTGSQITSTKFTKKPPHPAKHSSNCVSSYTTSCLANGSQSRYSTNTLPQPIMASQVCYVPCYCSPYPAPPLQGYPTYYSHYNPEFSVPSLPTPPPVLVPTNKSVVPSEAINEEYVQKLIASFEEAGMNQSRLSGKIVILTLFQSGSRYLQSQLMKCSPEFISFIIKEIQDHMVEIITDNFGNYFSQKLFISCSAEQRLLLLSKIRHNIYSLCKDKQGTHTVQIIVEMSLSKAEETIICFQNKTVKVIIIK